MQLNEKEIKAIDQELKHVPKPENAAIEALRIVQEERGWISDESLKAIAEYLDMSSDELDSVATFYNLVFRRPVGRHVILICDSISCWVMGYDRLREALEDHLDITLGETTSDDRFTLLPIPCLGTCDHAPALMIDEDLHRDLSPEDIPDLLDQYE